MAYAILLDQLCPELSARNALLKNDNLQRAAEYVIIFSNLVVSYNFNEGPAIRREDGRKEVCGSGRHYFGIYPANQVKLI